MGNMHILSAPEQVAERLRAGISRGEWGDRMPGEAALSRELGLDAKIVARALSQLEEDGLLENQGPRRRRLILVDGPVRTGRHGRLRIALLGGAYGHRRSHFLGDLPYQLSAAGHQAFYAKRNTVELGANPRRIERMVRDTPADAWVVFAGSRGLLEWFAERSMPVISVWGRHHGLRVASAEPDRARAYMEIARRLLALGHERIVLLARYGRRMPTPGLNEQAFLGTLSDSGIPVGDYNLPDWGHTVSGYHVHLNRMFEAKRATALVLDDTALFTATLQFLAMKGISVPGDVSLVCTEFDESMEWCRPQVSHIRWDKEAMVRRVVNWARQISKGKADLREFSCPAQFVEGGTIGPAKKG